MTKRMTAEEVADKLERLATVWRSVNIDRSIAHKDAACDVRENLVPQWQDEPDEETHAACPWWWCEDVPDVPQLLRSYRPLRVNPEDSSMSVDMNTPRKWYRWTVAGWIPLVGRVSPIGARPQ